VRRTEVLIAGWPLPQINGLKESKQVVGKSSQTAADKLKRKEEQLRELQKLSRSTVRSSPWAAQVRRSAAAEGRNARRSASTRRGSGSSRSS
jgi:hypothetical protein